MTIIGEVSPVGIGIACVPLKEGILTSKPIEPTPSTLKADLAVFVNSNMLITKIIDKNFLWLCVSSTSASKFEFLELPISTVSTLNSRVTRIYKFIYHALTFTVGAHSNLYARNINLYSTGI